MTNKHEHVNRPVAWKITLPSGRAFINFGRTPQEAVDTAPEECEGHPLAELKVERATTTLAFQLQALERQK